MKWFHISGNFTYPNQGQSHIGTDMRGSTVLPFMLEPVVPIASATSGSEEKSSSDDDVNPRLLNLDW